MRLRRWIAGTLAGHLVGLGLVFSLPLFLVFLAESQAEGTLTQEYFFSLGLITFGVGTIAAVLCWYMITLPIIKRSKRRK